MVINIKLSIFNSRHFSAWNAHCWLHVIVKFFRVPKSVRILYAFAFVFTSALVWSRVIQIRPEPGTPRKMLAFSRRGIKTLQEGNLNSCQNPNKISKVFVDCIHLAYKQRM
jgi:hypothetical protein